MSRPRVAISRYDNKTDVCPGCGQEEAIVAYSYGPVLLDPIHGKRPWVKPPK